MKDQLLDYYQQELDYLQTAGAGFAKRYPKIAGHLQLDNLTQADPQIARLMEALAFMNARVHHRLDDDFSSFTDGITQVLQPGYHNPLPSMVIAQFKPQPDLTEPYTLARHTRLERLAPEQEPLRFHTCYTTTLLPIEIAAVELLPHCETAPVLVNQTAAGCLHLTLRCLDEAQNFAALSGAPLRLFLPGSQGKTLYDLLLRHTSAIAAASPSNTKQPVWLSPAALRPVGFTPEESVLPYQARLPFAYQLLTEFFAYPDKFTFIEINLPELNSGTAELHLFFYLQQLPSTTQLKLNTASLMLGCTPLLNLYAKIAEPIMLTGKQSQYNLIADVRQAEQHAIYTIDEVNGIDDNGRLKHYLPLYSLGTHGNGMAEGYWNCQRTLNAAQDMTELSLSLTTLEGMPVCDIDQALHIKTHCFNPTLPQRWQQLTQPALLQLTEASAPITEITAVTMPTPVRYPQHLQGGRWRLISSFTQQHLSLMQAEQAAAALQELLQLYDIQHNDYTLTLIKSIRRLTMQTITRRMPSAGVISFCQGLAVTLTLEESHFTGSSLLLFIKLLEQVLNLQISLNSFLQLTAINHHGQILYQGQAMMGGQRLL